MSGSGQAIVKAVRKNKSSKEMNGGRAVREPLVSELRQIAEKYAKMIQSSPDAITLRTLPERRYVEVNEGFTHLTGYTAEEVIGKTSAELNLWVEQASRAATLKTLQRQGQVHAEEFKFRTKSGEVRYGQLSAVRVELNGEPFMLSITHDITDVKRAQEAVRQSEADLRSLVRDAPYGIYHVDVDGRLLQVNPALQQMLGYDSEAELLRCNMTMDVYSDPASRLRLVNEYWDKKEFREVETRWKRKDGRAIDVRLTGRTVRDERTRLAYFEVFAEDITERRSLERQFLQAQKMDAIGRLAGGIAHDFNNLLAVILGHSEILREHGGENLKLHKSAEAINRAAERAAGLTMQLLALSRKQVVEPKVVDVNAALVELEKMVRRVIREDIALKMKLDANVGRIKIDPGQLDQVLMNLVVNARDAMPNGGELVLHTARAEFDEMYVKHHLGTSAGDYVMLAVSDTGTGMDAATVSHIFEPFFTTKEKGKGTGLGLSTVYGIVKQAGGHIVPYSEPGQGTTMKIYFPRVEVQESGEKAREAAPAIPRGSEGILVVEDETALRDLTRSVLEESGYTVFEAQGLEEALRIVRENGAKISMLLTDVVMPGTGGRELAARLKALQPELKVMFMSGYADEVITHNGTFSEGAVLIQKPFTKRTLLSKIREMLDAEREINRS
jgi:two-component system, cell cycle sensor histidine kinase and response regulator CckA